MVPRPVRYFSRKWIHNLTHTLKHGHRGSGLKKQPQFSGLFYLAWMDYVRSDIRLIGTMAAPTMPGPV